VRPLPSRVLITVSGASSGSDRTVMLPVDDVEE
jgi:hypothetical protein